jgi:DNA-binding NtrC family response regulator
LVVDGAHDARAVLAELLHDEDYEVEVAATAHEAMRKCAEVAPHVVLVDATLGLELVRRIRALPEPPAVVLMTAFGAVNTAVEAMKAGAQEYLTRPLDADELVLALDHVLEHQRLAAEARHLRARLDDRYARHNIIGTAPSMKWVFEVIDQVAPSRATVLITGESGTGKELVAAAIHQRSPRASGPFVKVHCAALAESLLESELFGHERGSFTGAIARREGRFSLADGGTLFLDEIGEISPSIQVKLLRFLQEHVFERVGGDRPIEVDVRVIAATNRDLAQRVREGKFREDLYYRLDVVSLEMPPLRDRKSDIPALAQFFFERFVRENNRALEGFSPDALELLIAHDWPGNVRELENAVERAVVMAQEPRIETRHLPPTIVPRAAHGPDGKLTIPGATLDEIERYAILSTLEACGGSTARTAEILGISIRKVQYKLHEYTNPGKTLRAVPADD